MRPYNHRLRGPLLLYPALWSLMIGVRPVRDTNGRGERRCFPNAAAVQSIICEDEPRALSSSAKGIDVDSRMWYKNAIIWDRRGGPHAGRARVVLCRPPRLNSSPSDRDVRSDLPLGAGFVPAQACGDRRIAGTEDREGSTVRVGTGEELRGSWPALWCCTRRIPLLREECLPGAPRSCSVHPAHPNSSACALGLTNPMRYCHHFD